MPKKIREPKIELIQPKVPNKEVASQVKKSTISVKKDVKVENLYQTLAEVERTIQELTRLYVETEDSKHFGLGGTMKPTEKQMTIKEQLIKADERAKELLKKIK